jgi:hypothetical protein
MGGGVIMTDEQINAIIKEFTGVEADFLNCRDAQDEAHNIMAFKTCGANKTPEQRNMWDEYGAQLFKDGLKPIWQLTDRQWAEAYLRALGKWEEEA